MTSCVDFVKDKNHFCNSKYSYRAIKSTEIASLEDVDRLIIRMGKNETPIIIFLELTKAFDTLDHRS